MKVLNFLCFSVVVGVSLVLLYQYRRSVVAQLLLTEKPNSASRIHMKPVKIIEPNEIEALIDNMNQHHQKKHHNNNVGDSKPDPSSSHSSHNNVHVNDAQNDAYARRCLRHKPAHRQERTIEQQKNDPLPPKSLPSVLINCDNFGKVKKQQKIAKGATKAAYVASFEEKSVVLKSAVKNNTPRQENTSNVSIAYHLDDVDMARVFFNEAVMLNQLKHPNIIDYFGGCFDPQNVFNVVQGLQQWKKVVTGSLSFATRMEMAIGVGNLISHFNFGLFPLGTLLFCDFLPQQFGIDALNNVKLLDVEGLVQLPTNQSYLFADVKCHSDSICKRPGCYKSKRFAWGNKHNTRLDHIVKTFDGALLDEVKCDHTVGRCFGMGIDYNVYAMCRYLLSDLLLSPSVTFPSSLVENRVVALLSSCLEPNTQKRADIATIQAQLAFIASAL